MTNFHRVRLTTSLFNENMLSQQENNKDSDSDGDEEQHQEPSKEVRHSVSERKTSIFRSGRRLSGMPNMSTVFANVNLRDLNESELQELDSIIA